jgi:hypothetical protein
MSTLAKSDEHCLSFYLDTPVGHTFFMTTSKQGKIKKVVKSIVYHRTCATCRWWQRNRPGEKVRKHRCVWNHHGSAKMIECNSGIQGVKELAKEGTPVDIIEGDGDCTLMSRLNKQGIHLKKKYDKNHMIKNIIKLLYEASKLKHIKMSKDIIVHFNKCLKYIIAKHQGDEVGLEENLRALVPHQFGDHTKCKERFCGFTRVPGVKYIHKSLPYKLPLKGDSLRQKLNEIFEPVIGRAHIYADLGSSQANEHANKEVALRAPKTHHYGNSESLDFRVHATAAFVNEGRMFIPQVSLLSIYVVQLIFS